MTDDNSLAGQQNLWREVLSLAIIDATSGQISGVSKVTRRRIIQEARDYLTIPNPDFNEVCSLAGLDPNATRERLIPIIADAPSPEELVSASSTSRRGRKGRLYTYAGRSLSLEEWAKVTGLQSATIHQRLRLRKWPIEEALTTPLRGSATPIVFDFNALDSSADQNDQSTDTPPPVVFNFGASLGTGARPTAQDSSEITFHNDATLLRKEKAE